MAEPDKSRKLLKPFGIKYTIAGRGEMINIIGDGDPNLTLF